MSGRHAPPVLALSRRAHHPSLQVTARYLAGNGGRPTVEGRPSGTRRRCLCYPAMRSQGGREPAAAAGCRVAPCARGHTRRRPLVKQLVKVRQTAGQTAGHTRPCAQKTQELAPKDRERARPKTGASPRRVDGQGAAGRRALPRRATATRGWGGG